MQIVYLSIDKHIKMAKPEASVSDLGSVYCADSQLNEAIKALQVFDFSGEASGTKKTASVMAVILKISDAFGQEVFVQNIGEPEFIISLEFNSEKEKRPFLKLLLVAAVTFFGGVFAIMTYNEDVDVFGVFDKIAAVMRSGPQGAAILHGSYAAGIAAGIIVFFNHFGKRKLTKDPTPMEVEMEKYEQDVNDTLIKENAREGKSIDVS